MASFSIFQDTPIRPTGSPFTFRSQTSLSINSSATTPHHDKENVNPLSCPGATTRTNKKSKRKYIREEGAGPLALKKKVKVAFVGDAGSPIKKKTDRKRRVLGGASNALAPIPASLSRQDTLILDELADMANGRAIELTVSPLADASEAYLSIPGAPSHKEESTPNSSEFAENSLISSATISDIQSYFSCSQNSQASENTTRSLSPLIASPTMDDQLYPPPMLLDSQQHDSEEIYLRIPLPPSP